MELADISMCIGLLLLVGLIFLLAFPIKPTPYTEYEKEILDAIKQSNAVVDVESTGFKSYSLTKDITFMNTGFGSREYVSAVSDNNDFNKECFELLQIKYQKQLLKKLKDGIKK